MAGGIAVTAAVVTLAVALAGALGVIVYLVRRQQGSLDAEVTAGKQSLAKEVALHEAERQRDEAITAAKLAIAERTEALARLKSTQAALLKAKQEVTEHVVKEIKNAPSGTAALAALDELWSHVPGLSAERASASGGDGGGGTPAMRPASVAE